MLDHDLQARGKQRSRNANRGSPPKHLPGIEDVIQPKKPVCGCERHVIGKDVSKRLDIVPARLRVIVTCRPKYACRDCEGGIVQATAPARLIPGGLPTKAIVAPVDV